MDSDAFVVVPSYNHAPFIEKCLRSIIAQTASPKKLLVIDDGSSDGSPSIIESVLAECPFDSELIVRENRGLSRTLNQGFALSSGKYFAYLGSDDYWLPEFLNSRTRLLGKKPSAVLAYGHAFLVDELGEVFDSTRGQDEIYNENRDNARQMLLAGAAPVSSTVFYRCSALDNVSWNEEARLEDYELYLKLMEMGEFAFDNSVLAAWRQHGLNTSRDRSMMLEELLSAQKRNFESFRAGNDDLTEIGFRTKFRYARIALQEGDRPSAIRLAMGSWRGASSLQLVTFAARMFVPRPLIAYRRRRRKARMAIAPD